MKVLRAPNETTLTRVTSVGEVHFENGIATEFTDEQAQYFTERQKGYTLEEILSEEETAEATKASIPAKTEAVDTEAVEAKKIHGNLRGLAGVNVSLINVARGDTIVNTVTDQDGNWAFPPIADQDSGDIFNVDFFGEGVEEGDDIKDAQVGMPYGNSLSDNSESEKSADDQGEGPSEGEIETSTTDESTGEDESEDAELMIDITKADHPTLVEAAQKVGLEVDPNWSTEDIRIALLAKAENEGPAETGDTTEASQNASDGTQATPTGDSSDGGTGGNTGTVPEKIELPTARDSRRIVANWCRKHDVNDQGTKKELLERIYADERFKK